MTDNRIRSVHGRRVWDSRGRPTVEVEVRLGNGARGRAIAPAGASTGSGEALDLRDGGVRFGGYGVDRAVAGVNSRIADALLGTDASDQAAVDAELIRLDGTPSRSMLGGNAMIATSMAVAHAAANGRQLPLWRYLGGDESHLVPVPEIQIFGGGAHASGQMDLQDFMVVPHGASSFAEAMEWVAEIYLCAGRWLEQRGLLCGVADEGGYWPVFGGNEEAIETLVRVIEHAGFDPQAQVSVSLDVAATQLFDQNAYWLRKENRSLAPDEWFELLGRWVDRYPLVMIEDPFEESDLERHARFTARFGDRLQVVGDDLLVTNVARIEAARARGACNTLLCKPNQAGTLTEARAAFEAARAAGWNTVVSARSGESEDVTIVHLAMGWGIAQLKVGSFARSERMAKWNEMIRIEESLGSAARYAGSEAFAGLRERSRPGGRG
jgi:enolase